MMRRSSVFKERAIIILCSIVFCCGCELDDPPDRWQEGEFIPADEFEMGDAFAEGSDDELPVHTVYVDAFYMDAHEVTNAQYERFMDATDHRKPVYWHDRDFNSPNQPVVGVTWDDAVAYAEWAGKRLPTEAEWEKAARGGQKGWRYVWGNEPPPVGAGNLPDETFREKYGDPEQIPGLAIFDDYYDEFALTAPVKKFAPNGYGLYDMAGNVWEWCADRYDVDYYSYSREQNPTGPGSGVERIIRGGSCYSFPTDLRVATRAFFHPRYAFPDVGFRCVRSFDSISEK